MHLAAFLSSVFITRTLATTAAVVNFANNTGAPEHLASGTLYGLPENGNQIPDEFFRDIGWRYERAGGAQLPAPALGWIWGLTNYKNRFKSALSNYQTTLKHGGQFVFLIHDLWGADGTQNSSAPYPGDDGDWTSWDSYLATLFSDMTANGMTKDIIVDIWNEPDGAGFWARTQEQYLEMWGRTYYKFRAEFGTKVLLSGPASAGEPLNNSWFENWCSYISRNGSIPDQYAWHMEGGGGDLLSAHAGLLDYLKEYNLPTRTININEYGVFKEQVPSGSAWWIAQLERINAFGLRGNWLSGYQLHDFMASLIGKPDSLSNYSATSTSYFPVGDYQVYKYYNLNMTGSRYGTTPSSDLALDVYATADRGLARVLVGVRVKTGTWELTLNNLTSLGLAASGSLDIHTYGFPAVEQYQQWAQVYSPIDLGWYSHPYSDGSVTFPVNQVTTDTAFAFEFAY